MTDLWDAVGPEIEAEHATLRMARAKVSCASLWPFLAAASSGREFEHRLALIEEHVLARVAADLVEPVTASLREDFAALPKTALEDDANKGAGNPYYFTGGEEAGPATGETNQYPAHPTGSDPMDPIDTEYPAQPQPWTGGPGWVENPMQFGSARKTAEVGDTDTCRTCGQAVRHVTGDGQQFWSHSGPDGYQWDDHHLPHPQRYPHEGSRGRLPFLAEANPNYFSRGSEGMVGEGFPEDVAQEDPEDWANSFGAVPPAPSVSPYTAAVQTIEHGAPDSDPDLGTQYHSAAERERADKAEAARTAHRFFDPYDPALRFVAVGEGDPYGSDNPFSPGEGTAEGGMPETPSSLTGGPGSSVTGPANGGVPQTTSPRQMPGGGGMGGGMGGPPGVPQQNTPQGGMSFSSFMKHAESQSVFSDDDPTGFGDPYREQQVEHSQTSRPRIPIEHMHINTPQRSREPIRTVTSEPSGSEDREDEEEER